MNRTKTVLGSVENPFDQIDMAMNIIIASTALNPLDIATATKYIIPGGTPLAPVSANGGKYRPIRRTLATAAANNTTCVTVQNAKPFLAADVLKYYVSNVATSDVATIATIDTTNNVLWLTAAHTIASSERVEVKETGLANTTAVNPTGIPDCVILRDTVAVRLADGTLIDKPAVGVLRGAIRKSMVNGPGTTAFDTMLQQAGQCGGINFLPATPGE